MRIVHSKFKPFSRLKPLIPVYYYFARFLNGL